jgi:hypothetical protein
VYILDIRYSTAVRKDVTRIDRVTGWLSLNGMKNASVLSNLLNNGQEKP